MNDGMRQVALTAAIGFAAALTLAQIPMSRADIMKVPPQRLDRVAQKLRLSPDQVSKIKPLLLQQIDKTETASTRFAASDHGAEAKREATEAVQQSRASTKGQVEDILTSDQFKQWDEVLKYWNDDLALQGFGDTLNK